MALSPLDSRVLAIQLQQPKAPQANQAGQLTFTPSWRPLLSVTQIFGKVQTTIFFGNQLVVPGGRWQGSLDTDYIFHMALSGWFNVPMTYVQLTHVPLQNATNLQTLATMDAINQRPVSQGTMTLLDAGSDPQIGMWLEFAGNFWLTSPIFQGWANTEAVHRDGPFYSGKMITPNKNHVHPPGFACGCLKK